MAISFSLASNHKLVLRLLVQSFNCIYPRSHKRAVSLKSYQLWSHLVCLIRPVYRDEWNWLIPLSDQKYMYIIFIYIYYFSISIQAQSVAQSSFTRTITKVIHRISFIKPLVHFIWSKIPSRNFFRCNSLGKKYQSMILYNFLLIIKKKI